MSNPHKGRTGIDRVIRATGYSAQGMHAAYQHESAFRQELWLAAGDAAAGFLGGAQAGWRSPCLPVPYCWC